METPRPVDGRPALTVQSLGSGSSGNAYVVRTATTTLLVDCGVGVRQIAAALSAPGDGLDRVAAVVVTHEHSDHVRSLRSLTRRRVPLLMTSGTSAALGLSGRDEPVLRPDETVVVGDIAVVPVATSHDAAEPCGVCLSTPGGRVAVLTDMGCPNDAVVRAASGADLLVIEANHDVDMLRLGPYPRHLKRRVGSDVGHLSNRQAGEILVDALPKASSGPSTVWLAHLSATNNRPAVALETVRRVAGDRLRSRTVEVLPRLAAGPLWTSDGRRPTQLDLFD